MKTGEERIALLHSRAAVLKRRRDKRILILSGICSVLLFMTLISMTIGRTSISIMGLDGQMTGSSLLSESAGAYVLVAVVSFSAAVIVTMLCLRWNRKNREINNNENRGESNEN